MRGIRLPWLAGAVLLGGCTVGPRYHPPAVAVPNAFPGAADAQAAAPPQRWWTRLHDPELDSLVDRALAHNRDILAAVSRVREARAERMVTAGSLLPEVSATAGYNRGHGSKNVTLPFGGGGGAPSSSAAPRSTPSIGSARNAETAAGAAPTGQTSSGGGQAAAGAPPGGPASPLGEGGLPGVTTNLFQVGLDAVWELDLFGGTRRALEAADASVVAAEAGESGVRLALVAEVATTYLEFRSAQTREAIARRNLAVQRATWKLAEDRFHSGLGTEIDAAQAAAQAYLTEATLPQLTAAEQSARHGLAILLGSYDPSALDRELADSRALPELPPELPIGLPSDLIRRRPDLRQAERQLAAATAQVGVATAQLFPQFSITGTLGQDSSTLKHLPDWGSHYYSIAPGIRWPILDWSRLHAAIHVQNELQAQALLAYESAVASALKEVSDALVRFAADGARRAALARAVEEARRAAQAAQQTVSSGLADDTARLNAEKALLQAEDALAQSDAALRSDFVTLYKAVGTL